MAFTVPATSKNNTSIRNDYGLNITKPTGLADGDILYAIISHHQSPGGDFACSGWTALAGNQTTVGADMSSTVLRKVITDAGSEPASYTFAGTQATAYAHAGIIAIARDGDTSTPEDATTTESTGTNDDNPDSPSITTSTDGALVMVFCALDNLHGGDAITFAAPSGYTLADSENYGHTAQVGIAYAIKASAGATGAITWTNTADANGSEWHTYTVAVKPGEGGEPPESALPMAMRHYRNMRT